MSGVAGALNLVVGIVYLAIGVIVVIDLKRGWQVQGFSAFGAGFAGLAFTCGPHHLFHGVHVLFEGRPGGSLDAAAVTFGIPAGLTWFLLRVEAFRGGDGDRFVRGTPVWVAAIPPAGAVFVTALAFAGATTLASASPHATRAAVPHVLLVALYASIGWLLLRTQVRNRPALGGWSLSGGTLTLIFLTCTLMHAVHAVYLSTGRYAYDWHGFVAAWISVPAAVYFLGVVRGLERGAGETVRAASA